MLVWLMPYDFILFDAILIKLIIIAKLFNPGIDLAVGNVTLLLIDTEGFQVQRINI